MKKEQTGKKLEENTLPPLIGKWNWGAFFFSWIWAISNKVWIGLLGLIPGVGLVIRLILGLHGNEWAWEAKKWRSLEHFEKSQKKWDGAAVIVFVTIITIIIILIIAIVANQPQSNDYYPDTISDDVLIETSQEIYLGEDGMSYGDILFSIETRYELGGTLEKQEINPATFWNPITTNGKFIFVVIKAENMGKTAESFSANFFKLKNQNEQEYFLTRLSSYSYSNGFGLYDKDNQYIKVHDYSAQNIPLNETVNPGVPIKFGLLFEVAKDTESINVSFSSN